MRRIVLLGLAAGLVAAFVLPTAVSAKANKVDVCHLNDLGEWQVNSVSSRGRAVNAHLRHGDGLPGDEVPGMDQYTFDDDCVPVADEPLELIFAVAYTDVDESDGGYNPSVDVFIAKLVDGPGSAADGVIGVGDRIISDRYPLTLTAPFTYGSYSLANHTVSTVNAVLPASGGEGFVSVSESVSGGNANFTWQISSEDQRYTEDFDTGVGTGSSFFSDAHPGDDSDTILVVAPGPSLAEISVGPFQVHNRTTDDDFLDIDLNIP